MKKFLIVFVVLIALVIGAIIAVPYFLPMEKIEAIAKEKIRATIGRDVAWQDIRIRAFPTLSVRVSGVTVSNADWGKSEHMLSANEVQAKLDLRPLLEGRIAIERFVLKQPVINIEKNKNGKTNLQFDRPQTEKPADAEAAPDTGSASGYQISFGDLQIKGGTVMYLDHASGQNEKIEDVGINITYPDFESALQIDGRAVWKQKLLQVIVDMDTPMALAAGKGSRGVVQVKTDISDIKAEGNFLAGDKVFDGTVDASTSDLPGHIAWFAGNVQPVPFKTAAYKSQVAVTKAQASLKAAELTLDEVEARGDVRVNYAGKPSVFARLALNKLELDRFMPQQAAQDGNAAASPPRGDDWDETPLDFSALKAVDVDVVLDTQGFSLKGIDVGPSKLTALLKDAVLNAKSSEASLFGGLFQSDLTVSAAQPVPTIGFKFGMKGVQAQPVLKTFAQFEKLSGAADADINVTTKGVSQKDFVQHLNGKGTVTFKDGTMEGVDLLNFAKLLQKRMDNMEIGGGKTKFVDMGGTLNIVNGIVNNDDFSMRGPLVQSTGKGKIDLPKKSLYYTLYPKLTASSGEAGAAGLGIPVIIKGSFSALAVKPDYAAAVRNVLSNPESAEETLKAVKEKGKALEDNLKTLKDDLKKNPADALNNLLGSFGAAPKKQQQQPAPGQIPQYAPPKEPVHQ